MHKLLLLGAGESGKSTFYKQMMTIHGKGFPPEERKYFRSIVHSNTISAMQRLCRASETLANKGDAIKDPALRYCRVVDEKIKSNIKEILELKPLDDPLTRDICQKMKKVWQDPHIKKTFVYRGRYSLADSAEYFFERLDYTFDQDYIPSLQDIFRSRVRTTGILEQKYVHNDSHFNLFDVGGQRNG